MLLLCEINILIVIFLSFKQVRCLEIYLNHLNFTFTNMTPYRAYERGSSAGTLVRDPEGQEWACESLKGPIALAINVLFSLCSSFWGGGVFSTSFMEPSSRMFSMHHSSHKHLYLLSWTFPNFNKHSRIVSALLDSHPNRQCLLTEIACTPTPLMDN